MKTYSLDKKQFFTPLVYTIWVRDFCLYVGFSSVGLGRAFTHDFINLATRIDVRNFKYEIIAREYEKQLILKLKPGLNIVHNNSIVNAGKCKFCHKAITSGRVDKEYCNEAHKKRYQRLTKVNSKIIKALENIEDL